MSTDDAVRLVARRLEDGSLSPATLVGNLQKHTWSKVVAACPVICFTPGCERRADPPPRGDRDTPRCCCTDCYTAKGTRPGTFCADCPVTRG